MFMTWGAQFTYLIFGGDNSLYSLAETFALSRVEQIVQSLLDSINKAAESDGKQHIYYCYLCIYTQAPSKCLSCI